MPEESFRAASLQGETEANVIAAGTDAFEFVAARHSAIRGVGAPTAAPLTDKNVVYHTS